VETCIKSKHVQKHTPQAHYTIVTIYLVPIALSLKAANDADMISIDHTPNFAQVDLGLLAFPFGFHNFQLCSRKQDALCLVGVEA